MATDMPEVEAYAAALLLEIQQGLREGCSVELTNRRIAAIAELHAVLDPWQPCRCDYCSFQVGDSSRFSENL